MSILQAFRISYLKIIFFHLLQILDFLRHELDRFEDYILLLNSDTELYENTILETLRYYYFLEKKDQKIGFLGCQIKHQDGRLQPSCNYYWAGLREVIEEHPLGIKILQHWLGIRKLRDINKYENLAKDHRITWLGVPYALIRTELIQSYLFDENFFMYSEDEELNYRLSKAKYKPYFYSGTGVFHHIGGSSSSSELRNRQIYFSKLLFVFKTRGKYYFLIYCFLLRSVYKWNKKISGEDNSIHINWLEKGIKLIPFIARTNKSLNCYVKNFD